MHRIKTLGTYFLITLYFLLILIPSVISLEWIFMDSDIIKDLLARGIWLSPVKTLEGTINLSQVDWTPASKFIGFSAPCISALPWFLGFFFLAKVFQNYRMEKVFTSHNAKLYRNIGILFFVEALLARPMGETLEALAVTFNNPPGHRYLSVGFGTPNIEVSLGGFFVIVISWVMLEASRLCDDQQLTV